MGRAEVLDTLRAHREELRTLGARALLLFGSTARDEAGPMSDVDLLVELEHPSFDAFMDLKLRLEELLGRPVDLVTERGLKAAIRPEVKREAIRVA